MDKNRTALDIARSVRYIGRISTETPIHEEAYVKVENLLNSVYGITTRQYREKSTGWLNDFYYYLAYGYSVEKAEHLTNTLSVDMHYALTASGLILSVH